MWYAIQQIMHVMNTAGVNRMSQQATLYRIVSNEHVCPYGVDALALLQRKGFAVDDHHLTSRDDTEAFKEEHGVDTTPQAFIDGNRIGGLDELRRYFEEGQS
jgi:glutaredoxin